jgi:hemerythrin-like domain-containing protein
MHTTEILKGEHRLHSRLLDALEALVDRAASPTDLDGSLVRRLLAFFDLYVDGLHQEKEERALFPQLIGRIGHLEVPEVERLEAHHQRDRRLLVNLRNLVESSVPTDPERAETFVTGARAYVALQRRHMLEEDSRLIPLALETLTFADDRAVRAGFRRLEREHGISFEPEARRLLEDVTVRIGPVPVSEVTRRLGGGDVDAGTTRGLASAGGPRLVE